MGEETSTHPCTFSIPYHQEFLFTKDNRITTSTEFRDISLTQLVQQVRSIVEKQLDKVPEVSLTQDFTYQTVSIEPCVSENFAQQFVNRYINNSKYGTNTKTKNGLECRYMGPTLVYHGASSQRIIDSIAKRGFLHQGDPIEGTGLSVPYYHVLYGEGVYCSKDINVARTYSNGGLVVGLCYQGCQVTYNDRRADGCCFFVGEDVDSRIVPASNILIVNNAEQILPLFVIREERLAKVFQDYCSQLSRRKDINTSFGNEIYFRPLTHGYWEINLNSFVKQKVNSDSKVEAEMRFLITVDDDDMKISGSPRRLSDEANPGVVKRKKTALSQLERYFASTRASSEELRRFDTRRVHKRLVLLIETSGTKNSIGISHAFSALALQCKNVDEIAVVEISRGYERTNLASTSFEWISAPLKKRPVHLQGSSSISLCAGIDQVYSEIVAKRYELSLKFRDLAERVLFDEICGESVFEGKHRSQQDVDKLLDVFQSRLVFDVVCFSRFDLAPTSWTLDQGTKESISHQDDAWLAAFNDCIRQNSTKGNHGVTFVPIIHQTAKQSSNENFLREKIASFLSNNLSGVDIPHFDKLTVHTYDSTEDTNETPLASVIQEVVEQLNKYDTSIFQNMVLPVEFEGYGRGFVNDLLTTPVRCASDCYLYYGGVTKGCLCPSSLRLMLTPERTNTVCADKHCVDALKELQCFHCRNAFKCNPGGYEGFVPPYIYVNGERISVRIATSRFDYSELNSTHSVMDKLCELHERQEKSLYRSLNSVVRKKQVDVARIHDNDTTSQEKKVEEEVYKEVLLHRDMETFEEIVNFLSDFSAGNDFVSHLARLGGALKVAIVAHRNDESTRVLKPRKEMKNVDSGRTLLKDWCKGVQRSDAIMKQPQLVSQFMQLLTLLEKAKTMIQSAIRKVPVVKRCPPSESFEADAANELSTSANQLIERAAQSITLCPSRSSFLKDRSTMVNALQGCLNEIQKAFLVKSLPVEDWHTSLKEMKFAVQAVQRARVDPVMGEVDLSKVNRSSFGWPEEIAIESINDIVEQNSSGLLIRPDNGTTEVTVIDRKWTYSSISKKQDLYHFASLVECSTRGSELELSSHGMVGLMIDVHRHDASNVDPWKLLVRNVGVNSYEDTAMAYCHARLKAPLLDFEGNPMSDVVVLLPPPSCWEVDSSESNLESKLRLHARKSFIESAFYRSYLALVFTRNPWLQVPGQTLAITCITWVKLGEKLMLLGDEDDLRDSDGAETNSDEKSLTSSQHSEPALNTFSTKFSVLFQQYQAAGATIQELIRHSKKNTELLRSIRQNFLSSDPLKLTEKYGVTSLCLALAAIVYGEKDRCIDWEDKKIMQSVFLLLAESIARASKVYLKFEYEAETKRKRSGISQVADVSRLLIQRTATHHLNVDECGNPIREVSSEKKKRNTRSKPFILETHHISTQCGQQEKKSGLLQVDRMKALSESTRFFQYVAPNHPKQTKNLFTNCTPHGLASTLLLQSMPQEDVISKAGSKEELRSRLSMGSFFNKLVSHSNVESHSKNDQDTYVTRKEDLQISLYLQGVAYYASHLRSNVAFTENSAGEWKNEPKKIWNKIMSAEENLQRSLLEKQILMADRTGARMQRQLQEQQDFLEGPHQTMPKLFTRNEIDALNRTRSSDDQLELDPLNGLLKHHCACPTCPSFLVDMRTEKDHRRGTNRGLWRHLELFRVPSHHVYPIGSFHRILVKHGVDENMSKAEYVDTMLQHFGNFYGSDKMGKRFQIEHTRRSVEKHWEQVMNDR